MDAQRFARQWLWATTLGLRGIPGALTFLALTAGGGPVLGLVTGLWLGRRVARVAGMHGDQGKPRRSARPPCYTCPRHVRPHRHPALGPHQGPP